MSLKYLQMVPGCKLAFILDNREPFLTYSIIMYNLSQEESSKTSTSLTMFSWFYIKFKESRL